MRTFTSIGPSLVVAFSILGCASNEGPPPVAPSGSVAQPAEQTTVQKLAPNDNSRAQIAISDEIRNKCGLSDEDAHFAFDSAKVTSNDKRVLAKVAKCFTSGPLSGRTIKLVGRADPRGEEEYNIVLGGRRADSVKAVVVSVGLPAPRISATSRGALDASGTDEQSWAQDRRVDVLVGS